MKSMQDSAGNPVDCSSSDVIRRVCHLTRGVEPTRVERLHSICNDVFRLTFDNGAPAAVLKIYARPHGADRRQRCDRVVIERWSLDLLAKYGIPVPPVEAADVEATMPWILMTNVGTHAAGQTDGLAHGEADAVFRRCGELLARVHMIRLDEQAVPGPLPGANGGIGPDASPVLDPVLRWAIGCAERSQVVAPEILACLRVAASTRPTEAVLCHGDFHPDQCVRDDATVTAMVDWESATFGDAVADHAKFINYLGVYFAPEHAAAALAGYASVRTPPHADDPHYLALRLLQTLPLKPKTLPENDRFAQAWFELSEALEVRMTNAGVNASTPNLSNLRDNHE